MENEEFVITLTIEGTQYEEVEVEVTDPMKTIREQINSIVEVFHLPKMDNGGNPITYLLAASKTTATRLPSLNSTTPTAVNRP